MSLRKNRSLLAMVAATLLVGSLAGCSFFEASVGIDDIRAMENIPEGQKKELISQMEKAASSGEQKEIGRQAKLLNQMVGTELKALEPPIMYEDKYKLEPGGTVRADKNDYVYGAMSAADYWRLGEDTFDLCVEKECEYYSSWTVNVEKAGNVYLYVWTLKIEGPDASEFKPLVRRFIQYK